MKTSDFDYELPEELIAQTPVEPRDHSRLMVVHRATGEREDKHFYDIIDYLNPNDALVINETKVIPARLLGEKEDTGVPVEVLLLRRKNQTDWEALVRPGRRLKPGTTCVFGGGLLKCEILESVPEIGGRIVRFHYEGVFEELLDRLGEMPLPPYIHEKLADQSRYQTVYAKNEGSAAAPTAGLHFTPEILAELKARGVGEAAVTLHVGPGTFKPVSVENAEEHQMHSEEYFLTPETAELVNSTRRTGHKVLAVGTTTVRVLESCVTPDGTVHAGHGKTRIFLYPPKPVLAEDMLLTNFHLPKSTLLMLVSCFCDREKVLAAYQVAIRERMRFFSYGDCMLLI